MNKKALILDLDNTIYPVPSIGEELFKPLFELIENSGEYKGDFGDIKQDIMKKPFQKVAREYEFSKQLTDEGDRILKDLTYDKAMEPFEDYAELKKLPCRKFLVTTGYKKMQQSKVERLGLGKDFEEVHIVDPSVSDQTKKDIFEAIISKYNFKPSEVLVIGDDLESEIKAAGEIGVEALLYDKNNNSQSNETKKISDFGQLHKFL